MPGRRNRHGPSGPPERRQQGRCPVRKRTVNGKPEERCQRGPGQADLRPQQTEHDHKDAVHDPLEVTRQPHTGVREHRYHVSGQQSEEEQKDAELDEPVTKYRIRRSRVHYRTPFLIRVT